MLVKILKMVDRLLGKHAGNHGANRMFTTIMAQLSIASVTLLPLAKMSMVLLSQLRLNDAKLSFFGLIRKG